MKQRMERRGLGHGRIMALALCLMAMVTSAWGQTWTKQLAEGVTLTQKVTADPPRVINVLTVDPKAHGVQIKAVVAQDRVLAEDASKGRETVGSMAGRLNAIAAVNADFFPMTGDVPGDPLNLHISGAELISEPNPERAVFGITADGRLLFDRLEFEAKVTLPEKWFPIRGINRPRGQHELVAYTSKFFSHTNTSSEGSEAVVRCEGMPVRLGRPIKGTVQEVRVGCGCTPIPEDSIILSGAGTGAKFVEEYLKPGTSLTLEFSLKPRRSAGWENVAEAVGGGPRLVEEGKVCTNVPDQGFASAFYTTAHPRTAAGATADGRLVLATVDGRQSISGGVGLSELAEIMRSAGCTEAINLDGGGSTTMATSFGILNSPSGGIQRAVANGVAVLGIADCGLRIADFRVSPMPSNAEAPLSPVADSTVAVPCGPAVQLRLLDAGTGQPLDPGIVEKAIWSTTGGMGFVDQSGRFYGIKARTGDVVARIGSQSAVLQVQTVPGPPAKLTAQFEPDPSGAANRSVLSILVSDLNGNSVKGQTVSVKVTGGTPDQPDAVTGDDGKASIGITWDAPPGSPASAQVSCGNLPAQVIERPK
jgi:hypothetical protein